MNNNANNKNTLILCDRGFGDVILHHSLIQHLVQNGYHPIDLLLSPYSSEVAKLLPEIRYSHTLSDIKGKLQLWDRYKKGVELRKYNYQYAFVIRSTIKHACVAFFAKIPNRIGLTRESRFLLTQTYPNDKYTHHAKKFAQFAFPNNQDFELIYPKPQVSDEVIDEVRHKFNLEDDICYIALGPGSLKPSSLIYPAENIGLVSNIIIEQCNSNTKFIVLGSNDDTQYLPSLLSKVNHNGIIDLTGKTSIVDAAAILKSCFATITNDNGLMHLSAGLSVPTLGVFVSTSPQSHKPLGKYTSYIAKENNNLPSVIDVFNKFIELIDSTELDFR